jgi:hypothetical protein
VCHTCGGGGRPGVRLEKGWLLGQRLLEPPLAPWAHLEGVLVARQQCDGVRRVKGLQGRRRAWGAGRDGVRAMCQVRIGGDPTCTTRVCALRVVALRAYATVATAAACGGAGAQSARRERSERVPVRPEGGCQGEEMGWGRVMLLRLLLLPQEGRAHQ